MDYKKIIKSRSLRLKILHIFSFIPDKPMIKIQYWIKTGHKLNLKNPRRFTEKLQWYKLNYRDPVMIQCVDKYDVREYVESVGLGYILTKCYGVFDKPEDIEFEKLPNQFVIKDTLGGGGNSVIICKDKSSADLEEYRKEISKWMNNKLVRGGGREWPYYSGKKHRIIIEEYISSPEENTLSDYKFYCFNGKVKYLQYLTDRKLGNDNLGEGIFDENFNLLPVLGIGHSKLELNKINKPLNYDKMLDVASALSEVFPYARIDLYNILGKIYFGEITFFPASGYKKFTDDSFDYIMGESFMLPNVNRLLENDIRKDD